MTRKSRISILAFSMTATLAFWLAGCSTPVLEVTDTAERGNALLKKVTFDACPQTQEADWDAMLSAFKKSCTGKRFALRRSTMSEALGSFFNRTLTFGALRPSKPGDTSRKRV